MASISDLHQLRFLTLEDIVQLPAVDDGVSESIGIPNGFKFGHSTQASVYVSSLLLCIFKV